MFRRKLKQPSSISEEEKKMIMGVAQRGEEEEVIKTPIRPQTQTTTNDYFIAKKEIINDKQIIVSQTGQIIETGSVVQKEVVKIIYQLSRNDIIDIIKGVDEDKKIFQIMVKLLNNEI